MKHKSIRIQGLTIQLEYNKEIIVIELICDNPKDGSRYQFDSEDGEICTYIRKRITKQKDNNDELITVCSACLTACCFQGADICEYYETAGTLEKTVKELRELNLESPNYWS